MWELQKPAKVTYLSAFIVGLACAHFVSVRSGLSGNVAPLPLIVAESLLVGVSLFAFKLVQLFSHGSEEDWFNLAQQFRWVIGAAVHVNFMVFWAAPIAIQGQLWKLVLVHFLRPIYNVVDQSQTMRKIAFKFIYAREKYADFFAQALCLLANTTAMLTLVFYHQFKYGTLPWWVVITYYFMWVGLGGRGMGAAYTFAHKEGHMKYLYREWIRKYVGNFFENWLGPIYGNVPYNFTTSHVHIHHRTNGGKGDTYYQWDLDRSSWSDFMVFLYRSVGHCSGITSLRLFRAKGMRRQYDLLFKGMMINWVYVPLALLAATRSFSFLFWVYLQPQLCMTYFLAFINFGFHAFIEMDEKNQHIWCINSTKMIECDDDYYGEMDHIAHHYATQVYHSDLDEYTDNKKGEYARYKASVFRHLSIVEVSLFVLLKEWGMLADKFVDYSKSLSKEQVMALLKERAERREMTSFQYQKWLNRELSPQPRKAA